MSPVTLELPESLLLALERQAEREGVSVECYVIDTLTDLVTQRLAFEEMTTRYPHDQAEAALRNLLSSRQLW